MRSTTLNRRRSPSPVPVITEIVSLIVLCGAVAMSADRFGVLSTIVQRGLPVLAFAAGVATSMLLIVAAWMSADAAARRIAAAVGLYTVVLLLTRAVGLPDSAAAWPVAACLAALGSAGLLVLAVRHEIGSPSRRVTALLVGIVATSAMLVAGATAGGRLADGHFDHTETVDLLGWSGILASALALVAVGVRADRGLLRRVGLAFAVSAIAHNLSLSEAGLGNRQWGRLAAALELGGAAMLLAGAALFLATTLHGVLTRQEDTEIRLAEAEAAMAEKAERDHEIRNLVAGLTGAATVLKADAVGQTVDGRRLLVAAGAELERLQQMLRPDAATSPAKPTPVVELLADLAAVHRATGLTVHVETEGGPEVAMERGALSQVLTNLLVNCSRHAPGAPVWLRCRDHAGMVRIEVADAGPGLPGGAAASVVSRGVRGPGSSGEGLGLAISADIVGRHGGTFALSSGSNGCVARLDLPSSAGNLPHRRLSA